MTSRREFIRNVGIALASLAAARCIPGQSGSDTPRDRLRDCWLRLDWLARETQNWNEDRPGEAALDQLVAEHHQALGELVAAGALTDGVSDQVQAAFNAAAYHVWRSNAPITCYEPVLVDYRPSTSSQLVHQADLLAAMAADGNLDPETAAQAQAAIERDIAFLTLSDAETQILYDALIAAAGDSYGFPPFSELDLEVSAQAAEAARFLVALLLE